LRAGGRFITKAESPLCRGLLKGNPYKGDEPEAKWKWKIYF
jgi:hypothetical protein